MGGSTFSRGKGVPEPAGAAGLRAVPGGGGGGGGGVRPAGRAGGGAAAAGGGGGAGGSSEEWVASEFRWNFGGSDVYVTGSWDGWSSKTPLYRGEAGVFWVVVALAAGGRFQYKYVVDGNWRHSPAEETELDDKGNLNNVRWVRPVKPEFAADDPLLPPGPSSPVDSYDCRMLPEADLKGEPPSLPPQLAQMPRLTETARPDDALPRSSYVCLNHLYVATAAPADDDDADGVTTLQMFSRYKSKNIATSFVTGFPRLEPHEVLNER